jgi:hypothetical protein
MAKKREPNQNILESLGGNLDDYPEDENTPEGIPENLPTTILPTNSAPKLEEDVQQVGASAEEVQALAKQDMDFLAALVMPLVFKYCFPPVFKAVWEWLLGYVAEKRSFPQLALGLPRGFGKSTVMKLFLFYCIVFTDKKFIAVIAANAKLAENIVSDVMDMLEEPNIIAVFGDWRLGCEKDTQSLKKFGFRGRNITIATVGGEGPIRGLNIKNERPDVMLFDDIQSKECADSEVQSTSLETWLIATAMKAKSPMGCMFLFVANMYPTKHSLLRKFKQNHTWTKFIAGGILADGTSLWEELQPIKQLTAEFENDLAMGHPEIFYSEVLNDENVSFNNRINLSKLPDTPYQDGDISAGSFVIIDPATDKIDSDAVSIGYFEVHNARPMLMELKEDRFSPGETITEAIKYCLKNNCRLVAIEANAYQYSLKYWFDFICLQMGIRGIEVVPIYSGVTAKNNRILTFFKAYSAGEIYCHPDCRLDLHLQVSSFNPMKRDNTDGLLDLMTYAPRVMVEFEEYVIGGSILEQQEFDATEVVEFNSCF